MAGSEFLVRRNPEEDSKLPYLLLLPLDGGLVLKAREAWPRSSRVYCHPFEDDWPADAEIIDRAQVVSCRRRGAAIDLVLDRPAYIVRSSSSPRSVAARRSSGRRSARRERRTPAPGCHADER